MAVSERQRHALHEWVRQQAGEEVAETMMDLLPPVGWADIATKRDLDHLERRIDGLECRIDGLDDRIEGMGVRLRAEILTELHRELRRHTYWIMTSVWAAVGVAVGVSQALAG